MRLPELDFSRHVLQGQESKLRVIEVDKDDLIDLPEIVDQIAERPEKFIVFCDDLSFDAGEGGYKALKKALFLSYTVWFLKALANVGLGLLGASFLS